MAEQRKSRLFPAHQEIPEKKTSINGDPGMPLSQDSRVHTDVKTTFLHYFSLRGTLIDSQEYPRILSEELLLGVPRLEACAQASYLG